MVLRQTESAQVAEASRHMDQALSQLAARYEYLRGSLEERREVNPLHSGNDRSLRSLTEATLIAFPGMEGGFYAEDAERLLGYAFPTYSGSGPKTDIPAAEQPTIQRVVAAALVTKNMAAEQVAAGPDLILFRAQALLPTTQPRGAIWVMHRLSGIRNAQQQWYGLTLLCLLVVSMGVASGAWMLTRRLDRGAATIEAGLRSMEDRLDASIPAVDIVEFERIRLAINRLASTHLDNQARRADLEQRLRQADRLAILGRLVAGVAHELRNPLASVKLKLHLAKRDPADPVRLNASYEVIEAEIGRMDRLVERMLSLAKPAESSCLSTDLARFLAERIQVWESRAASQRTIIEFQAGPGANVPVLLDRDRVGQILDNLVANALDALACQGGAIVITAEVQAKELVMTVSDTGPGISPEVAEHVFEPFFTTRAGGTGLGLFLSAEMARVLGGELRLCDRPGDTRFELRLPC